MNFFVGFIAGVMAALCIYHAFGKRGSPSDVKLRAQILELKNLNATAGKTIEDLRLWLDTAFGIQDLPTVNRARQNVDDIEDWWGTP